MSSAKARTIVVAFLTIYTSVAVVIFVQVALQDAVVERVDIFTHEHAFHDAAYKPNKHLSHNTSDYRCVLKSSDKEPRFLKMTSYTWIISAYYDTRMTPQTFIRVLALMPSAAWENEVFAAHVKADNQSHLVIAPSVYPFNENHEMKFGGFILNYNTTGILRANPCYVTIASKETSVSIGLQPLQPERNQPKKAIGVCVPPLHNHVSGHVLNTFAEITQLLGADNIHMYVHQENIKDNKQENVTPSHSMLKTLSRFESQNRLQMEPWRLPISSSSVWYFGQMLAIHHCLYTNMHKYKYLWFTDVDEITIPRQATTWAQMLDAIDAGKSSGFCFQSAFFPLRHLPKPASAKKTFSYVLEVTNRTRETSNVRTKCVVRPEKIYEMGIHHISKWLPEEWTPTQIRPEVALVHHYRNCIRDFKMNCNDLVEDLTALRYHKQLEDALDAY